MIQNFEDDNFKNEIAKLNLDIELLNIDDINSTLFRNEILKKLTLINPPINKLNSIAEARTFLQLYLYKKSKKNEIIWILDDDMEFKQTILKNNEFDIIPLNTLEIINYYKNKNVDVVIGSYSNDAPLPLFSTLRSSLLDYVFNKKLHKKSNYYLEALNNNDYYYDLSENNIYFETPLPLLKKDIKLDDVFSNKTISRPLFFKELKEFNPYTRGGNTLIFNKEVLKIPNYGLQLDNLKARRSDYFWVKEIIHDKFKVIASSFTTFHNKKAVPFDYQKEMQKTLLDLIGSSFVKSICSSKDISFNKSHKIYKNLFLNRMVKIYKNYFRIIGLLEILNNKKYLKLFTEDNLNDFIYKANKCLDLEDFDSSIISFKNSIKKAKNIFEIDNAKIKINKVFKNVGELKYLNVGCEGIVLHDNNYVYKLITKRFDKNKLYEVQKITKYCDYLEDFDIGESEGSTLIRQKYYSNFKEYQGGYILQIVELINFLKENNLSYNNFKKDNFIIVGNKIKLIDYGQNFDNLTNINYQKMVERSYQMIKYNFLNNKEFLKLVIKDHNNKKVVFNYGIENYLKLFDQNKNTKENIHDNFIFKIINKLDKKKKIKSIFDYGAGKCKIANQLSKNYDVSVYDINQELIKSRANNQIKLFDDALLNNNKNKYDLLLCNLVLCCVDNKNLLKILNNLNKLLNQKGTLLLSICNPYFVNSKFSSTLNECPNIDYLFNQKYYKTDRFINRVEYHRSFEYYERILNKYGFKIKNVHQTLDTDVNTLNIVSPHLIIECTKNNKYKLNDVSLLIQTCVKEYKTIYDSVVHIVNQLEKYDLFEKIVLTVDGHDSKTEEKDFKELKKQIKLLKNNAYIDRVVYNEKIDQKIYKKWFSKASNSLHPINGQNLYATLNGFEQIKSKYIFQTDSDIIFMNNKKGELRKLFEISKNKDITFSSLSICHDKKQDFDSGHRIEVRNCLINKSKMFDLLPVKNEILNDIFDLTWHRALDNIIDKNQSIRFYSNSLFFIHPQNDLKKDARFLQIVKNKIEKNEFIKEQLNNVDLVKSQNWNESLKNKEFIIFSRGYNTDNVKLLRFFNSLKMQKFLNFKMVYIDDASNQKNKFYAKMVCKYDPILKNKNISIFNDYNVSSLNNYHYFIDELVKHPDSIIVNIDNDDCLYDKNSLQIIKKEFDKGHDLTVGNLIRLDRPWKHYLVKSFTNLEKSNGDNIWLHPKSYKKGICKYQDDDLKINNQYIKSTTDYAMLLPIIKNAKSPKFIDKILYVFDPSNNNLKCKDEYKKEEVNKIMNYLITRYINNKGE